MGALFLGVFGVVVFQALLVQGQAHLDHLNAQIATQQQESKQLHLQVAQLDSPERIVTYARNNLHMVDPAGVVYLQQAPGDDAAAATTPAAPAAAPTTVTTAAPAHAATQPTTAATHATAAAPAHAATHAASPSTTVASKTTRP